MRDAESRVQHDISTRTVLKLVVALGAVWLATRLWPILLVLVPALFLAVGVLTVPALLVEIVRLVQNAPEIQAHAAGTLSHSRLTAPLAVTVREFCLDGLMRSNAGETLVYSGQRLAALGHVFTSVALALYVVADRGCSRSWSGASCSASWAPCSR